MLELLGKYLAVGTVAVGLVSAFLLWVLWYTNRLSTARLTSLATVASLCIWGCALGVLVFVAGLVMR